MKKRYTGLRSQKGIRVKSRVLFPYGESNPGLLGENQLS
jgi:hypothetical protein